MSQRRMFSPDIVCSEEFLSMPVSSRDLYFQLGMRADDDGFIQPKIIMRTIGSDEDDLKILLVKRFLLPFNSGVVVIKHWLIHNMIRLDRYKETRFIEEKKLLFIKENKAYTDIPTSGLQIGNQMAPQVRLGKDRIGEEREEGITPTPLLKEKFSEEDKKALADIATHYNSKINPKARLLDKAKDKIKLRLEKFSVEEIRKAIDNFSKDEWKMKNLSDKGIAWFFHSDERIEQYINLKPRTNFPNTNASISSEIEL